MKLILVRGKHLTGRHDQSAHGRGWNGGRGRQRDERGRFTQGGRQRGSAKPNKPLDVDDRVQLPDKRSGRVVVKSPDGKLAVLWDDGQAGVYSPEELFPEGKLPDVKPGAGKTKSSKRVAAKHDDITNWLDKGDLLGSGGDEQRGDQTLKRIWKEQGFDGLPNVVSEDDLDKEIADGAMELWRGLANRSGEEGEAEEFAKQFLHDNEPHPGLGVYGNGTYSTPNGEFANQYTSSLSSKDGALIRMALRPGARTITYEELLPKMFQAMKATSGDTRVQEAAQDFGRAAAMMGYDAILVGGENGKSLPAEVVILNRTAISISSYIRKVSR